MNILVIGKAKLGHGSGYGQAIWNLVSLLTKEGFNLHVICHSMIKNILRHPKYGKGLYIYPIPTVYKFAIDKSWSFLAFYYALKILKKHKIDLIHGHSPHSYVLSLMRRKVKGIDNVPYVVTFHDTMEWESGNIIMNDPLYRYNFRQCLKRLDLGCLWNMLSFLPHARLDALLEGIDCHSADVCVYLTRSAALSYKEYCHVPEEKIKVISNGVLFEKYYQIFLERMQKESSSSFYTSLTLGGSLRKGVSTLLRAIPMVGKELRVKFIVIGSDFTSKYLLREAEASGLIEHKKYVPSLRPYLLKADIFTFPTLSEGFPQSLLEAMASGLPVVTTNAPGPRDIVEDGVTGLIVPMNDPEKLSGAIHRLLTDEQLRTKLIENGAREAKKYDWRNVAKLYAQLYESLA